MTRSNAPQMRVKSKQRFITKADHTIQHAYRRNGTGYSFRRDCAVIAPRMEEKALGALAQVIDRMWSYEDEPNLEAEQHHLLLAQA